VLCETSDVLIEPHGIKEPIVLDNVLNSALFTLIGGLGVAVGAIALQPSPRAESGAVRAVMKPSASAVEAGRSSADAANPSSPPVVRLPTVVVTGRRNAPSEIELMSVAAAD
jgi:hypothetical protein